MNLEAFLYFLYMYIFELTNWFQTYGNPCGPFPTVGEQGGCDGNPFRIDMCSLTGAAFKLHPLRQEA